MAEHITVYYDYTCLYSYRVLRWLGKVEQAGRELTVTWRAFPLKEVNRGAGEASFLSGTSMESVSILALELAKTAQAAESASSGPTTTQCLRRCRETARSLHRRTC